jgi:hypothetical protein
MTNTLFPGMTNTLYQKVFFYNTFVFLKRTFDPIHVIPVSIWHLGDNLVIAQCATVTTKPSLISSSAQWTWMTLSGADEPEPSA